MDNALYTDKLQVERKWFYFDVKENPRGRFLRITEDVNGRRDAIVIPTSGLADFKQVLDRILESVPEEVGSH